MTKMIRKAMLYFKASGKMDRKTGMVFTFMDKMFQFITRVIGKMT